MATTRVLILMLFMSTIHLLTSQGDFDSGGNMGDVSNVGDFDNNFEDLGDNSDSAIVKLGGNTNNALGDLEDTFNDFGDGLEDTFNDFGDGMVDAFNNFDFADFTSEQKKRFDDLLNKVGSFTQDQIDQINDALTSGNLDDLDDMDLTEDQKTAIYSALEEWNDEPDTDTDTDSGSVRLAVGVMSGLVLGNIVL